jgi:mono/diheme cytochrome c family protein
MPIGSMVSANLTPAGVLKDMTDGQVYRVLREGIGPDGRLLAIMSSARARYLSEEDLKSVIAYLRSQPAAGELTPNPPDRINYLGALLTGAGMIQPLPPVTEEIVAPPKAAAAHYGKYLISFQDCMLCHGDNLTGGTSKVGPVGPGLRQVKGWTQEQFITAMRTGVNPNGMQLKPPMPWQFIGRLDDTDLAALYQYIVSLE